MHLLFIIFLFLNCAFTHASALEERSATPRLKVNHLRLQDTAWECSIFNRREDIETPDLVRVFYLNLTSSDSSITINGHAYQLVYLEAALPKSRYSKRITFPSFFKKHSVTVLKHDSFSNFYVLSKLVEKNPKGRLCETLSFFEYFPESEESYTISFIKQTDLAGFQSNS